MSEQRPQWQAPPSFGAPPTTTFQQPKRVVTAKTRTVEISPALARFVMYAGKAKKHMEETGKPLILGKPATVTTIVEGSTPPSVYRYALRYETKMGESHWMYFEAAPEGTQFKTILKIIKRGDLPKPKEFQYVSSYEDLVKYGIVGKEQKRREAEFEDWMKSCEAWGWTFTEQEDKLIMTPPTRAKPERIPPPIKHAIPRFWGRVPGDPVQGMVTAAREAYVVPEYKKQYIREVMGFSEKETKGWTRQKWKEMEEAHYPGFEPVSQEDLITIAGMVTASYGIARATYTFAAPAIKGAFVGSRAEMWLIKHSKWYEGIAKRGITGIQVASYPLPTTEKGYPVFSKQIGEAQNFMWALEATPKTSAVTLSKFITDPITKESLPHFFYRRGAVSVGYLTQGLSFKKGMDLLVPETTKVIAQKTFVGTQLPHIPTAIYGSEATHKIVTSLVATPSLALKFIDTPIKAPAQPQELESFVNYEPYTTETTIPILDPLSSEITLPKQEARTEAIQETRLKQVVVTTPKQRFMQRSFYEKPPITTTTTPRFQPYQEERRRRRRKEKPLDFHGIGKYRRVYPVATPREAYRKVVIGK